MLSGRFQRSITNRFYILSSMMKYFSPFIHMTGTWSSSCLVHPHYIQYPLDSHSLKMLTYQKITWPDAASQCLRYSHHVLSSHDVISYDDKKIYFSKEVIFESKRDITCTCIKLYCSDRSILSLIVSCLTYKLIFVTGMDV